MAPPGMPKMISTPAASSDRMSDCAPVIVVVSVGSGITFSSRHRAGLEHKKPLAPDRAERGVACRPTRTSDGTLAKYYGQGGAHDRTVADRGRRCQVNTRRRLESETKRSAKW